ncbi:uncharacterized protein LOC111069279 [Drosophila obscura]|uniref:uncharacterized protein LOC111069279 n=1 Tax=Drosophila obscura TaxID=7282 RepID=UPI000B9FC1B1|nr:uncharacterized protein LOC111069279 [Drosophila obscura]
MNVGMATQKKGKSMTKKEFVAFRAQYEPRVKKLEHDVFEWLRSLDKDREIVKVKSEHNNGNGNTEKKMVMSWQYDMKEFSFEEITLYHEGSSLHLRAYHKSGGKSIKVKNEIVLPEHVDESKISSKLSSSGILTISVALKTDIPEEKNR